MSQVNQAFEPDAAADPKEVEMSAEGAKKEAKTPIEQKPIKYAKHPFPGFKPYPERGCTDCLCIVIFAVALIGWMVLLAFSVIKGKPEIIKHSTDYKGNVCGFQLKDGNTWENGKAPKVDIKLAKKGVFPRMVDDFIRLVPTADSTDLPSVSDITITTFCAEECPKEGDIFCTYEFSQKYEEKKNDKQTAAAYAESPLGKLAKDEVKVELLKTATLTRDAVAKDMSLLDDKCGSDEFCKEVFNNCDRMVVDTVSVMSRCVPNPQGDDEREKERCIQPLQTANCTNPFTADPEDWTKCVKDKDTGFMKKVMEGFECVQKGKKCLLPPEVRKKCREVEDLQEFLAKTIPQAEMTTKILKNLQSFAKYVQDVRTAAGPVAVCGMVVSVIIGFLFLTVVGRIAGCFVWTSILLTFVALVTLSFLALIRGGVIAGDVVPPQVPKGALATSEEYVDYYKIAGIFFSVASLLFFVTIIFLRRKIVEAIKVVKIAANAVTDNYKIVFWPIISFIFIGLCTLLFIFIGCMLMASVNPEDMEDKGPTNRTYMDKMAGAFLPVQKYAGDDTLKYLAAYDLVMWLWVCEFVQAIGIFVIGGTVTHWYFTPKGTKQEPLGNTSRCARCQEGGISGAFCIAVRKHLGTAIFGSAVIAVIQTIRIAVAYMLEQMKGGPDNRLVKCLKACIQCCLGCFEKCAKYLSKNAYIYTSIHGSSFCLSAYKSFVTIFNNLLRFGATGISSGLIMLFGKVFVTFGSTVGCYLWLTRDSGYSDFASEDYIDQKGTIFVCAVVAVMAFIVAQVFFGVYEITSDSIMLSYCLDVDEGGAAYKDKLGEDYEVKKAPEDEHEDKIDHEEDKKFCCGPCACK